MCLLEFMTRGTWIRTRINGVRVRENLLFHPLDEPSRRRLAEHGSTHLVEKRFEAARKDSASRVPCMNLP